MEVRATALLLALVLGTSACGTTSVKSGASSQTSTSRKAPARHRIVASDPVGVVIAPGDCGAVKAPAGGRFVVQASTDALCKVALEFVSRLALGVKHPTARGFTCSLVGTYPVGICKGSRGKMFNWSWAAKGFDD